MRKETIRTRKRRTKPMIMLHAMLGPNFFNRVHHEGASDEEGGKGDSVNNGSSSSSSNSTCPGQSSLEKLLKYNPKLVSSRQLGGDQLNQNQQADGNSSGTGEDSDNSQASYALITHRSDREQLSSYEYSVAAGGYNLDQSGVLVTESSGQDEYTDCSGRVHFTTPLYDQSDMFTNQPGDNQYTTTLPLPDMLAPANGTDRVPMWPV